MSFFDTAIKYLPEITPPTEQKQGFKTKLKWTSIVLALYFILTLVPLNGLESNALEQFEFLSTILGASFGSIISLGIGPIVNASIVLQLLNGSGILSLDTTSNEGKKKFQGYQKMLAIFFTVVQSFIFVSLGGFVPAAGVSDFWLVSQLTLGGLFIIYMDDIISKYGFGSGVSLFIAAGVSQQIFTQLFSPLSSEFSGGVAIGAIPAIFASISGAVGDGGTTAAVQLARLAATALIFFIVVYLQAMKVEIPLSFGRVKGHGIRWPLNFLYASVIPIILVAAFLANIQLLATFFSGRGYPIFGTFTEVPGQGQVPASGLVSWVAPQDILRQVVETGGSVDPTIFLEGFAYVTIYAIGAIIFSYFWVQTSGLDARSQAKKMMASGLQIPGFRKDRRVLERLLSRYIGPLTFLGGLAIGLLASIADLIGAIGSGTGLLLTVMIIYRLYEEIAKQHMYDMNPMMRKFMKG